jgi:hypothetical protein
MHHVKLDIYSSVELTLKIATYNATFRSHYYSSNHYIILNIIISNTIDFNSTPMIVWNK